MIHETDPQRQASLTPGPCICPNCGHRHNAYDQQASTVLDCLLLAREALTTAQDALGTLAHVIEEEVLP